MAPPGLRAAPGHCSCLDLLTGERHRPGAQLAKPGRLQLLVRAGGAGAACGQDATGEGRASPPVSHTPELSQSQLMQARLPPSPEKMAGTNPVVPQVRKLRQPAPGTWEILKSWACALRGRGGGGVVFPPTV